MWSHCSGVISSLMQLIKLLQAIQCGGNRYALSRSFLLPALPPIWSCLFSLGLYGTLTILSPLPSLGWQSPQSWYTSSGKIYARCSVFWSSSIPRPPTWTFVKLTLPYSVTLKNFKQYNELINFSLNFLIETK